MLDRTDRSLVGVWWWTVDKWLLASAVMLIVIGTLLVMAAGPAVANLIQLSSQHFIIRQLIYLIPVSYTHLRAHETEADLVCRLLLEKKKKQE